MLLQGNAELRSSRDSKFLLLLVSAGFPEGHKLGVVAGPSGIPVEKLLQSSNAGNGFHVTLLSVAAYYPAAAVLPFLVFQKRGSVKLLAIALC